MSVDRELYDLLQVEPSATAEDIKKAFRKLALKYHPDRGGDQEQFKKLNNAYEILSDPEKRRVYDLQGKEGLSRSGNVSPDILSSIFGQFGGMFPFANMFGSGFAGGETVRHTPSTIHSLPVTLENLCTRKIVKLKVTRDRLCACLEKTLPTTCQDCNGQGKKVIVKQFGFMIQQSIQTCSTCEGEGKIYNFCKECKNGIISNPKLFEIHLSPEFEDGYRYTFKGEGNQLKGASAGDFIVVIRYEKHPVFEVVAKDLKMTVKLSLKDALCGHVFNVLHPSGEVLHHAITDVTTPSTVRRFSKGMTDDSSLIISYCIEFPILLNKEQRELIKTIFT
jgi:DnaJ family protein A protein 2